MNKKYVLIGSTIAIVVIIAITFLITNMININLIGSSKVNVNVFEEYHEQKVNACVRKVLKCVPTKNVKITSNVNTKKIGSYEVKYQVKYGPLSKTITRQVNVIDNTAPTLTLKGNKELTICPNKEYEEEGYDTQDNYDKNIKVTTKYDGNKLIYTATDSSGNKIEDFRIINKEDKELPSFKFDSPAYIKLGSSYTEQYSVTDNCDGDLKGKVKVTGTVDTNKEGTYTINYEVEDTSGNKQTAKKIVYVFRENNPNNATNKIIYLTFDDGPGPYTGHLLDVLDKYNVKATFFVTNQYGYLDNITRMYNEGHSIGAHTSSHDYNQIYQSTDAYFNDLNIILDTIERYAGYRTNLIRFPGGSSNMVSRYNPGIMSTLTKEVENRGFQYYDWNIDSMDTSTNDPTTIASNVIKYLGNGSYVVLQHDIKEGSVNAVESIIQYGLTNGYTFLPLNVSSPKAHHHVNN